jgi:hypothetical protein
MNAWPGRDCPRTGMDLVIFGREWAIALRPRRSVSYRFPLVTASRPRDHRAFPLFDSSCDVLGMLSLLPPAVAASANEWLPTLQALSDALSSGDRSEGTTTETRQSLAYVLGRSNAQPFQWMGFLGPDAPIRSHRDYCVDSSNRVFLQGRMSQRDGRYLGFRVLRLLPFEQRDHDSRHPGLQR